jgi:hypothetical protein
MDAKPSLRFDGFQLDRRNQELRRESHLIALPPKTFSIWLRTQAASSLRMNC